MVPAAQGRGRGSAIAIFFRRGGGGGYQMGVGFHGSGEKLEWLNLSPCAWVGHRLRRTCFSSTWMGAAWNATQETAGESYRHMNLVSVVSGHCTKGGVVKTRSFEGTQRTQVGHGGCRGGGWGGFELHLWTRHWHRRWGDRRRAHRVHMRVDFRLPERRAPPRGNTLTNHTLPIPPATHPDATVSIPQEMRQSTAATPRPPSAAVLPLSLAFLACWVTYHLQHWVMVADGAFRSPSPPRHVRGGHAQ